MSTELLDPATVTAPKQASVRTAKPFTALRVAAVCVGIGFLPILFVHLWGLLGRSHYQFLVLLPIAAWLLVLDRDRDDTENWSGGWLVLLGLMAGLAGLYQATRIWSPFLAAVAAVVTGPSFLWLLGGVKAFRRLSPAWVMAWIAIPLPFGWDEDLIIYLRTVTTVWSGHVLDELNVHHLISGNVVELPIKSLFIADACSGVHSLYVLLGAALFLGLWHRRSWLHIGLLLVAAGGIVLVENVSRIVSVALGLMYKMDLSEGTKHELLGYVLFGASLLLLISVDRLIHFFVYDGELWGEKRLGEGRRKEAPGMLLSMLAVAVSLCFVPLGGYQLWAMRDRMPQMQDIVEQEINLPELSLESMPEKIGSFARQEFTTIKRVHGDPFGQASQQWVYGNGDITLRLSVDYPYQGIHDLCLCYEQTAWDVTGKQVLTPDQLQVLSPRADSHVGMARLYKPLLGSGVLLFSHSDLQGREFAVIKELARGGQGERARNRFEAFTEKLDEDIAGVKDLKPPYLQFHLVARGSTELSPEKLDEVMSFFLEARRALKGQCLSALTAQQVSRRSPSN